MIPSEIPSAMSGIGESSKQDAAYDDLLTVSLDGLEPLSEMSPLIEDAKTNSSNEDGKDENGDDDERESNAESDAESNYSEEIDPTPLEYGRANGLMRNYLAEKYNEIENLRTTALVISTISANLPQLNLGEKFKLEERMSLSKDGAALLASIVGEETYATMDSLIAPMLGSKRDIGRMKLELPLLRSDNRTDCKNFAKRADFEIRVDNIKLPLEAVDEANGQGLGWPARFWNIGPQLLDELKRERVSIPKNTTSYLAEAVRADWTETDGQILWNTEVKYERNPALEPVTPPLSPIPAKTEPFEPSSTDSAFNVPFLSEPPSPTKRQLEEIEQMIFMQDVPTPLGHQGQGNRASSGYSSTCVGDDFVKLGDVYSPLASMDNSDPPVVQEIDRMKREDLKVEELLTPEGPATSLPKAVRFNEVVEELTIDSPQSRLNSPDFENRFFEEAFAPAAALANQLAEQEKLVEADATARVDVPFMDFSKPDPPWTKFEGHKDTSSLLTMQTSFIQELIGPAKCWPGSRKGDLKLRWVPWDKDQANIIIDEHIEEDPGALEAVLQFPSERDVIDSFSLTWKPSGLMILQDDEDADDEIEPGRFAHGTPLDLTSLIKKRKLELQEGFTWESECAIMKHPLESGSAIFGVQLSDRNPPGANSFAALVSQGQRTQSSTGKEAVSATNKTLIDHNQQSFGGLLGGTFSAENSLDNYLEVRGNKKVKVTESSYFKDNASKPLQRSVQVQEKHSIPKLKSPLEKTDPLPTPPVPSQKARSSVIIASSLMKQRNLVKHLQILLPSLELVERDFSAHNTTTWIHGSVTRSPIVSPLAAEADLIVSASTGIIITTLQKIKQRLLPGQKGKPAVQDRVEQASLRYEKLVVFVSEGRQDESTNGLGDSDCLAFSEFMGFTLGLDTSVCVQFVAGGEETLAKWISSTVLQCLVPGPLNLLADETLWELFLRRAGMNAFAAQVIIESLKAPEGASTPSPTKIGHFGLTAFVKMGHAERIARFGQFCGKKLLERVSAAIERKWEI